MKSIKSQNYYEVIGVSRYASPEEIRRAYEICKTTFKEDSLATYSLFSDDENQEIFAVISRAYETLVNPKLRREYDTFLSNLEGKSVSASGVEEENLVAGVIGRELNGGVQSVARVPTQELSKVTPSSAQKPPQPETPPPEKSAADARLEEFIQSVTEFNGRTLRKVRTLRGVSVEDLAELTKIRKTYLEYLEEESFEFLPAPVYIKGFIIIIANALGLPANKVADDYMTLFRASVGDE